MSLETTRVGIIGAGAMGRALASGLLSAGLPPSHLRIADVDPERGKDTAEALGLTADPDNDSVVGGSDAVLLAVKPGAVAEALAGIDRALAASPLWISIAAGVPLARLAAPLPKGARLIRAMPNTPALVGEAATAFVANAHASPADRDLARAIFEAVGEVWEAPSEGLLDAVTGLSGSGPAYVFVLLEALGDAGVRAGLPRDAAQRLATQTVLGAARLAQETGKSPALLKDQVTSPGGTTIAGLEALEERGFRSALYAAVAAATARSKELGD